MMRSIQRLINIASTIYMYSVCKLKGVSIGKKVRFKRTLSILKNSNAQIHIGNNTLFNSSNYGYHINMHSPCKILADRMNAFIHIGDNCRIHGTCIHAFKSITIGNNVLIAANTQIIDANAHALSFPDVENRINTMDNGKPIVIEDNVWIGANCFILGGVTIGEGSVIAANSVVYKNIPPMQMAGGNPCVLIKDMSVKQEMS